MLRILLCVLICCPIWAMAQQTAEQCRWLKPESSWQQLDSLSVLPASIRLPESDSLAALSYELNSGMIRFDSAAWPDSVLVCYRRLPYALHKSYYNRSLAVYDSSALYESPVREPPALYLKEELFAADSLEKSGSISRGISFGNRQNVFVQSALNLQLDGKLSDRINIRAAISDQSVPFQPEGNTQNLQEFDKVFIELYDEKTSLTAGDIVLQQQDSYFLKYLKNVQGLSLTTRHPFTGLGPSQSQLSMALAKGKFASVNLEPIEGLSGPYKLPGPAGQQFVIVLSNSEQVYLDGRLLKRGFNYDYTIDYNLGEISFNPGVVITRYSRIRIDYEYSDQSYSRSILEASHSQQLGPVKVYSRFYQEKDNRNQPLTVNLSDEQKTFLSQAGDSPEGIYMEAVDSVGYHEHLLLYRKVDTLDAAGNPLQYYAFSNDPSRAFYQLSFADVGSGNGNYIFREYIGKGKVYEYVAPQNGQPMGQFEPLRLLNAPTQRNMLASGAEWQIDSHQQLYSELALSTLDENLFSEQDSQDDKGTGLKTGYRLKDLPVSFLEDYRWQAGFEYEFIQKSFSPIDRFRSIEFDRDWGLSPSFGNAFAETFQDPYDDHLLSLRGGLRKNAANHLEYRLARRRKGALVDGWQQETTLAKKLGLFQLKGNFFQLHNQQQEQDIRWIRWQAEAAMYFDKWVPGYRYQVDRQATRLTEQDSLVNTLMNFDEHSLFLQSGAESKNDIRLEYSLREDQAPVAGEFEKANLAHTTSFRFASQEIKNQQFRTLLSYRHSTNLQDSIKQQGVEKILTGQFNWLGNFFKNTIRSEIMYTVGSGRELKRDYVYVRMPTGEGTHTWRDENENGVQELSEFYEAINPDEKEYLRIFVPNNDFILAYTNELQYRLTFQEVKEWAEAEGIKQLISRFSGNASWKISKKVTEEGLVERFVPFVNEVEDASLLHARKSLQLNLFFNRSKPRWGLDGAWLEQERKQLLSAGFETNSRRQLSLGYRYNIGREWGFKLRFEQGRQANLSDYLQDQQFSIFSRELRPEISWMPTMNFQLSAASSFKEKENHLNPEQAKAARLADISLDSRYSRLGNSVMSASIRQVHIAFDGQENAPAAYNILEALRPGTNWVWNLNMQQRLLNGLQLTISYEGRKSEEQQVVHLGRMMMQALF